MSPSSLHELARRSRLLWVGGKGGVGKTTTAAALALAEAERGRTVRLVSTDPAHNLGHLFDQSIGDAAEGWGAPITETLSALELDPQRVADRHLSEVEVRLRQLMPEHLRGEIKKQLELARRAPGLHEAALLERVAVLTEEHFAANDDALLVFDTAPSGHTARLLVLPELMSAWASGLLERRTHADRLGRAFRKLASDEVATRAIGSRSRDDEIRHTLEHRRARLAGLRDRLLDTATTQFVLVLAAERLPVLESLELAQTLSEQGIRVGAGVVSRRLPEDAGPYFTGHRARESEHLARLRRGLPELPLVEAPLLAEEPVGLDGLRRVAQSWAPCRP